MRQLLAKTGVAQDDIDVWECNEAFAAQALSVVKELGLDPDKVNPNGSGISLGHPIGATGVSMHVMTARQLAGDPCGAHLVGARLGGVFNMGGAGVANHCSIVERVS